MVGEGPELRAQGAAREEDGDEGAVEAGPGGRVQPVDGVLPDDERGLDGRVQQDGGPGVVRRPGVCRGTPTRRPLRQQAPTSRPPKTDRTKWARPGQAPQNPLRPGEYPEESSHHPCKPYRARLGSNRSFGRCAALTLERVYMNVYCEVCLTR